MGTILASAIIAKVRWQLQDMGSARWTDSELLAWISDGQRLIYEARPSLFAVTGNITLTAGTRQSAPAGAVAMVKVVRNMGADGATPGNAIRQVPQDLLDTNTPDWHSQTPSEVIQNCVLDPRTAKTFYVFPPAVAGTCVEAVYTIAPAELTDVSDVLAVDDVCAPALPEFALFRAFSKDLETAGSEARAAQALAAFNAFLNKEA